MMYIMGILAYTKPYAGAVPMTPSKKIIASLVAASILVTSGCSQMGINKEQGGTVIGAGIAGFVCNRLSHGKLLVTIGCAGIGGLIGNRIGAALDERDQQALAATTQQVLQRAPAVGQTVAWKSDHTAATGRVVASKEFVRPEKVVVKRVAKVDAAPADLQMIQAQYITVKNSNVRAAPDAGAEKVGALSSNTEFTAIGKTGDWVLVGRKGVNVGYVSKSLVMPKPLVASKKTTDLDTVDVAKTAGTQNMAVTATEVQAVAKAPVLPVEAVTPVVEAKPEPVAEKAPDKAEEPAPTVLAQDIVAQAPCRDVSVSVVADGKATSDTSTLCKKSTPEFETVM
jgi:surface antigen